ncbi:hypothetical protein DXG03_005861 [Asterophora parasitica]|uniref:Uncharacterized protein n=1 Tax=Asterophora parasitica TaxID=117018 RepID=A0A9P7K8I9_9AGAR|nr:hypothetical protein DXG03_005861 [Asterophora parasitica]
MPPEALAQSLAVQDADIAASYMNGDIVIPTNSIKTETLTRLGTSSLALTRSGSRAPPHGPWAPLDAATPLDVLDVGEIGQWKTFEMVEIAQDEDASPSSPPTLESFADAGPSLPNHSQPCTEVAVGRGDDVGRSSPDAAQPIQNIFRAGSSL